MSYNKLLAVLLLVFSIGCDRSGPRSTETPPAKSSQREVDDLQAALDADATARQTPRETVPAPSKKPDPPTSGAGPSVQKEPPAPAAVGFSAGEGQIRIQFTDMPDLGVLSSYVKIAPDPGPLVQRWEPWCDTLVLKGDFLPRTAYRLVVKKGCPLTDGRFTVQEFVRTWTTGDRTKRISFASDGRYLPSAGSRAVALKTCNVTNLLCQIRMVPVRNLVQLLAREEDRYGRYYGGGGDSSDTEELAAEPVSRPLRVRTKVNEDAVTSLPIRDDDGRAANGVYLVSARDADDERGDMPWRLVCVTDIGLSVREANGTVYVWATSLTKGVPVKDLRVLVYGANNVVMAEGLTDAEGWCSCEMPDAGRPFAVVASRMDGSDTSFLALSQALDEAIPDGARRAYVPADGSEAFVWTERGIYRHGERILVHALLRNGRGNAPKPFPVRIELVDPEGKVYLQRTQVTDAFGAVACESFSVCDDQKSGGWTVRVRTPGEDGVALGSRRIKIEEFVPPQIRVKVEPPVTGGRATSNLLFTVSAEHLFGGPAKGLPAEAAVRFEDAPFAPKGWEAFRFGDENRCLQPNFEKLDVVRLDANGRAVFSADFPARAYPRAAVRMTVQGSVFESGGRPASARAQTELHAYPFYIGVQLPETASAGQEPKICRVVLVNPDGTPHPGARRLTARFERIDRVFGLRKTNGCWEWRSDEVRASLGEETSVDVLPSGMGQLRLPVSVCGDCAVTLTDEASGVSFGARYWVGGASDTAVRTALENPSRVTLKADRPVYYPGERPRLVVKAPFAGVAWLSVMRDEMVYSQVLALTNATSEILLEPVTEKWAPGVDVALSVVQSAGGRFASHRAFGVLPLRAATRDSRLDVKVAARVRCAPAGGSTVEVTVDAQGEGVRGERAVVTVVDEGIHILTDEKVPDPAGWFGETREAEHPLYDLYYRLLPILDERLRQAGAKTGGGGEGDLFRRISPMPTRRFRPLSTWKLDVPLANGRAVVPFVLPEFVGEIRATAVAYGTRATGAGAVQAKVTPNLVMQPDAPRFAAPGDMFLATVTLSNRSGKDDVAVYDLMAGGALALDRPVHGEIRLAKDASTTLSFPVRACPTPGEGTLVFISEGMGEKHKNEILLPVRPAAAWRSCANTFCLKPGERRTIPNSVQTLPEATRRTVQVSGLPVSELASALSYLVQYPYGCLEQTVSRVFPLVAAGGILNTLPTDDTSVAKDAKTVIDVGIRRVCSTMRANGFTAWPDTDAAPWDPQVSLWAAHFLVSAGQAGYAVPENRLIQVKGYLRRWAMSTNETVSVYACHALARAGAADQDRMLHWFDSRARLSVLERCRLARAFICTGDRDRARELLRATAPETVIERATALLAHLELDPRNDIVAAFAEQLLQRRSAETGRWENTEDNAHALLALGAFYRTLPSPAGTAEVVLFADGREETLGTKRARDFVGGGDIEVVNRGQSPAFVSVRTLAVPDQEKISASAEGIRVSRRYFHTDGTPADLNALVRGEMLIADISLQAPSRTRYTDLVLEDLLPACFEPDVTPVTAEVYSWTQDRVRGWELRRELRDDRVLGFSKAFELSAGETVSFLYAVRVVSAGSFILPGPTVEAMYHPSIHANGAPVRIRIAK